MWATMSTLMVPSSKQQRREELEALQAKASSARELASKHLAGHKPPTDEYELLAYWEEVADLAAEQSSNQLVKVRNLDPQPSYSEIAAVLGVTGPSVASRLRTLEADS